MPHALIIGGSLGGLFSACLLRTIGWQVTVFERSKGDLAGRGAGLGVTEELLEVFRRIGGRIDLSSGVVIDDVSWIDASGDVIFNLPRPSFASAWPRMYQPLRELVSDDIYRPGMNLEHVTQDADSVTAHFSDGTAVRADLLVAADGNLSTVRKQFLPDLGPRYAGYVAWRGIVEEHAMSPAAQKMVFGRICYSFPEGELMLTMGSPGPGDDIRPGHRRCYFIWYRPAPPDVLRELLTDAQGQHHAAGIPPPLIRPEFIREIKGIAPRIFAAPLAEIVNLAPQPLLQPISDMETTQMVFGRVALVGDSAFIARPHVAAGVTKAALDAQCLADELARAGSDIPAALARFEEQRMDFGRKIVAHSRYLGESLETHPGAAPPTPDPRRIITDYGAPHLVRQAEVSRIRTVGH